MTDAAEDRLRQALMERAEDNRIACPVALDLARREDVNSRTMARLLDELGIKIRNCQLGCF